MSCNNCCEEKCCQDLPLGNDACNALHQYNNENIKALRCQIESLADPCKHLIPFLGRAFSLIYCLLYNIIRNICAIWDILLDNDGYVSVTRVYRYTVPKEKFIDSGYNTWFSGSPEQDESFINIPIGDMDLVDAVVAQPQVVGARVDMVTVAIQNADKQGNIYVVNFDTYIHKTTLDGDTGPYAIPIVFIVVGRKKVNSSWS